MRALVIIAISLRTKFNVLNFTRFTDMMGPKNLKNGPCDHNHTHLGIVCNPETNTWYILPVHWIWRL